MDGLPIPAEHGQEASSGRRRSGPKGGDQMPLPCLVSGDCGVAFGGHTIAMPLKFGQRQNALITSLFQTMSSDIQPVSHMAGDVAAERTIQARNFRESCWNVGEFRSRPRQP